MAYQAVVTRVRTRPLEGADNLLLADCLGYQVIVGKDVQDGELGVFFEQGGQLSEEFATVNDLIIRKDADGNRTGGMFDPNRRVKAIKLRGARSDGFWMPLSKFTYTGADLLALREGDQFDTLNEHLICTRYETPATRAAAGQSKAGSRANGLLPRHIDTEHLRRNLASIPAGATIYITEKLHGTSMRFGHAKVTRTLPQEPWWKRFITRLMGDVYEEEETAWEHLNGSRNVVMFDDKQAGYYESNDFRHRVVHGLKLHKGEIIFGEIVGWAGPQTPIMSPQTTDDKKVRTAFGDRIVYSYGCEQGQAALYVYRIAVMGEDGVLHEKTWEQVKGRCRELGIKHVPEIMAHHRFYAVDELLQVANELVEGETGIVQSGVDKRHPIEGVVVRWEKGNEWGLLKHKSHLFGVLEGYLKNDENYIDTEEAA